MLVVDLLEHPHRPGYADGAARGACARDRSTVVGGADVAKVILGGCGGCGLAAVERGHLVGGGVVVERECTAADSRRLRLDESEHRLRGHQGVGRGSAVAEDLTRRLRGERICRRSGIGAGLHWLHPGAVSGRCFGSGRDVGGRLRGGTGVDLGPSVQLAAGHACLRVSTRRRTGGQDQGRRDGECCGAEERACVRWTAHTG